MPRAYAPTWGKVAALGSAGQSTGRWLAAELARTLAFADRNLERLDEFAAFWKDDPDPFVSLADKISVEAGLLAYLATRAAGWPDVVRTSPRLIAAIETRAWSPRNYALLERYPHTAVATGILHVALRQLGRNNEDFDRQLAIAMRDGHAEGVERLPFRTMEVRWLRALLEPGYDPHAQDLLPGSILYSRADPVYMSPAEVYALTHWAMYLTDFGHRCQEVVLDRQAIAVLVDSCLRWHLLTGNFDLLAELLLAQRVLVGGPSPAASVAWRLLHGVRSRFGFLPSPSFNTEEYAQLSGTARAAYAFAHVYHTEFVWGILCSVLLDVRSLQPATVPAERSMANRREVADRCVEAAHRAATFRSNGDQARPPDARPLLAPKRGTRLFDEYMEVAASDPRRRPWLQELARAVEIEQVDGSVAAGLVADSLLLDAARNYDLALVASLLGDAAARRLELTPAALQVVRFLLRQQAPDGSVAVWDPKDRASDAARHVAATFSALFAAVAYWLTSVPGSAADLLPERDPGAQQ